MIKWIGQHIVSLIARFRNDVYLEDLTTTTETNVLVVDSVGKISKSTSVAGDLTSIVAGTGLSGTGLTGPIPTLSVDAAQTGVTSLGTLSSLAVTSSSTIGVPTVKIDAQDADKDALYIDATDLTTGHGLTIASDAAKSNTALHVDGDFSGNADNASSVGIKSYWHKNSGLVSQQNLFAVGILSEMDDNAGNNANSAVLLTAFKGVVDSTSSTGNNWNTGLELVVTDGSLNTGILLNVENGGDDIKMVSNGDTGDYCTIATTTHGATTITTVDDDATAAHFEIAADGNITLDAAGNIALEGNTTVDGTLTMGSTAFASDAGVIQVATQGTIDHDSLANFVTAEHVDWAGSSAGTIHSSNYTNTSYGQANASTFGLVKHSATANNIVPQAVTNIASRSYQVNAGENSALTVNVPWTTPINIQGSSTSCTGNAATSTNLTASTSTAVGLGTIELGHATDTTVARSAAGTVTIEGDQIVTANVNKGKQVHINLRKNDNFLFYINTKTFWYSAAGYTYTYNNAASAGNFAMSFVRQTRMASYIAPYACKVKKIYLAAYYNTTATTAALDFEWAMHKWTPVNNSNGNATATLMTMTDRDGALAENKNHSIYWDITDNSASTMAAGDALGFAARCVDSSSASRQLWYGEAVVVVELI